MNILSITSYAPCDGALHAGGKTYNSYIKFLAGQCQQDIKLTVIAFSRKSDLEKTDCKKYGIDSHLIISSGTILSNFAHAFFDIVGKVTDYGKIYSYYKKHCIVKNLNRLRREKNIPDIIELEWTDMVLLAADIKKILPSVRIVGSEHDVSFLGLERAADYAGAQGNLNEYKKKRALYELLKKLELEAIRNCDVVMPHNLKDEKLLRDNGIDEKKIFTIVPYYHDMSNITRENSNGRHDILFWGAMGRTENIDACLWFIKNVMPLIDDIDVRFIIAGNNPPKSILDCAGERVVVTGYVEDETSLFEKSMCFVSPLLCGAGIKIKVLEALSSGIPVLTNSIGIEGIPAVNNESFLHCESPKDYAVNIRNLYDDTNKAALLGKYGRNIVKENFDLKSSQKKYLNMLLNLACK